MNAVITDSVSVQLKKYVDEDRTVVVAGNREFGPPRYRIEVEQSLFGVFHALHGMPHSARVTARDNRTNELILSFYTRV